MQPDLASDPPPLYEWMDLFRFAAASLVAISHCRDILVADYAGSVAWLPFYALTGFGHSGVIVFFVLSGFWIGRSVLRRIDAERFWSTYMIDRLSRLWIVLIPAILLGGLFDYLGSHVLNLPLHDGLVRIHSLDGAVEERLNPLYALGNAFFLQTVLVPVWGSNGPLWSLAYEFWFYVWFPALAMLFLRRKPTVFLLGLAIAAIKPVILVGFLSWMTGVVLLLALERRIHAGGERNSKAIAALMLSALWLGAVLLGLRAYKGPGGDLLLACSFAAFLFCLGRSGIAMPRLLRPAARYGSNSSYSLYIIHFPLAALLGGMLIGDRRFEIGAEPLLLVLALTSICILAGYLLSLVTERNTQGLRRFMGSLCPAALPSCPPEAR